MEYLIGAICFARLNRFLPTRTHSGVGIFAYLLLTRLAGAQAVAAAPAAPKAKAAAPPMDPYALVTLTTWLLRVRNVPGFSSLPWVLRP